MSGFAPAKLVSYNQHRLDDLIAMWRKSFEAGVGVLAPHSLAQQREYFVSTVLPSNNVCLALLENRFAGFIAASAESTSQLYVG